MSVSRKNSRYHQDTLALIKQQKEERVAKADNVRRDTNNEEVVASLARYGNESGGRGDLAAPKMNVAADISNIISSHLSSAQNELLKRDYAKTLSEIDEGKNEEILTASSAVVDPAANSVVEREQLLCTSAAVVSSKKSKLSSDIVDTVVEDKICCTNDVVVTVPKEKKRKKKEERK